MLFGNKKEFAIEYILHIHPYADELGLLNDSWGELRIWVEDVDLLEMYSIDNNSVKKSSITNGI